MYELAEPITEHITAYRDINRLAVFTDAECFVRDESKLLIVRYKTLVDEEFG